MYTIKVFLFEVSDDAVFKEFKFDYVPSFEELLQNVWKSFHKLSPWNLFLNGQKVTFWNSSELLKKTKHPIEMILLQYKDNQQTQIVDASNSSSSASRSEHGKLRHEVSVGVQKYYPDKCMVFGGDIPEIPNWKDVAFTERKNRIEKEVKKENVINGHLFPVRFSEDFQRYCNNKIHYKNAENIELSSYRLVLRVWWVVDFCIEHCWISFIYNPLDRQYYIIVLKQEDDWLMKHLHLKQIRLKDADHAPSKRVIALHLSSSITMAKMRNFSFDENLIPQYLIHMIRDLSDIDNNMDRKK